MEQGNGWGRGWWFPRIPSHRETIVYNTQTQLLIPLLQAASIVFIAVPSLIGGLAVFVRHLSMVWTGNKLPIGDGLLLGGIAAAIYMVALAAYQKNWLSQYFRNVLALVTMFLMVGIMVAAYLFRSKTGYGMADLVALILGMGFTIAGALLTWKFVQELYNPNWPPSPEIEMWWRYLEAQSQEQRQVIVRDPLPVTAAPQLKQVDGESPMLAPQRTGLLARIGGWLNDRAPVTEQADWRINYEVGNLCWFIALVQNAPSLSRESVTGLVTPTPRLPYPERVAGPQGMTEHYLELKRAAYEALINRAVDEGLMFKPGGKQPPTWIGTPERALRVMQNRWRTMTRNQLPFPAPGLDYYPTGSRDIKGGIVNASAATT